jgi:exo-1,4-beta-D-glucosaminidase
MYWQLYDTYLQPNGAFYGTKKACSPLHAIYRYGFNDIYIANEDLQDAKDIALKIRIFDINSKEIFAESWKGDIKSNTSEQVYQLPKIKNLTPVYFLKLQILDKNNKEVDNSVYWLSTKKDVIDWEAAKALPWPYYSPSKQFADYTALDKLPKVKLDIDYKFEKNSETGNVTLEVTNPASSIVFFTYFDVVNSVTGEPVLPVFWDDNYITLLPGETQTYHASFNLKDSGDKKPVVKVKAWNVDSVTLK